MQQAYIACCPDRKDKTPGSFYDIIEYLDDIHQPTDDEKLIVKFVDNLLVNGNITKSKAEQLEQWLEKNAKNVYNLLFYQQNINLQPDIIVKPNSSKESLKPANPKGSNQFYRADLLKGWLTKMPPISILVLLVYYLTNKQKVNPPVEPKDLKQSAEEEGLKQFPFKVVTVNPRGATIKRESKQASYFTEDLGNGVDLDMVYIPEGSFSMGSPETEKESNDRERPQHQVSVQPFFLGKYQVTQAQWRAVANLPKIKRDLKPYPSYFKGKNRPVEGVNWYDAVEFCDRLSEYTGTEYRLPSEAEWEYACRAGTTTPFHYGETITSKLTNYDAPDTYAEEAKGEYRGETTPVGHFPYPNGFGLYDMHGNVWEWCADPYHDNYEGAPRDGSIWAEYNNHYDYYILRGGSWFFGPGNCRSACRFRYVARAFIYGVVGFRVARGVGRT
ncbi:MAG: formylglycine-generating enzyme family protein [Moorea sp. SIO3B2]|nr:formylglycine-generating enzyme family protein [Moorena sp. SIO3B2]NEP66500.1 formylglycine-generating enzyme family protein [Moorena sp. SIO3A5]